MFGPRNWKNVYYKFIAFVSAADEERKVRIIEEDVAVKQKMCEEDLRNAEPMLVAAKQALNILNKVMECLQVEILQNDFIPTRWKFCSYLTE